MAIEQRGFFSVPHTYCDTGSVYDEHLQGPVTLTPIAERLAVELIVICQGVLKMEHTFARSPLGKRRPIICKREFSSFQDELCEF